MRLTRTHGVIWIDTKYGVCLCKLAMPDQGPKKETRKSKQ